MPPPLHSLAHSLEHLLLVHSLVAAWCPPGTPGSGCTRSRTAAQATAATRGTAFTPSSPQARVMMVQICDRKKQTQAGVAELGSRRMVTSADGEAIDADVAVTSTDGEAMASCTSASSPSKRSGGGVRLSSGRRRMAGRGHRSGRDATRLGWRRVGRGATGGRRKAREETGAHGFSEFFGSGSFRIYEEYALF
jgi:hypothetical protein